MKPARKVIVSLAVPGVLAAAAFCLLALPSHGHRLGPDRDHDRRSEGRSERGEAKEEGEAGDAFTWWYGIRAFPNDMIPKAAFYQAFQYDRAEIRQASPADGGEWSSIGPNNIGGRVLSLAIDPTNDLVVWAGAASGGLWKSTTGGEGASAWTLIDTGFPSISVSSILLDSSNPQVMYIGTGEMSLYGHGMVGTPGARSSYGLGVLKSTDGGATWETTGLTWTFDQRRAVFSLRMDPNDHQTVWAATSEGLYKSTDGGATFNLAHNSLMAMDVAIDPHDSQNVFVTQGQLNSTPDPGIYRSTDGGTTWTKLGGGLPTSNFGRAPLAIFSPSLGGPPTVLAGVSDASSYQVVGLFRSTNNGQTWTDIAPVNWAGGQAWYDNVVGVNPHQTNLVLCGGLDWYRSTKGGSGLGEVSYWYLGYGGVIPPGGAEGPPNYVHADQHAIAFDPSNSSIVYVGCDGGVFKSTNSGVSWAGKNGGLITTQIYNGLATGFTTSPPSVGGLQDNGTILYTGSPSWSKIFGGDGGWCALDPTNSKIIYEEYVDLDISKSMDGGNNWTEIHPGSGDANFIAPFVVSETNPNVLYAGEKAVQKSTDGGNTWVYPDGNSNWDNTPMAVIGVSFTSPDTVLAGTGSSASNAVVQIRQSTNGGTSWTDVTGNLPNRFPTDIGFKRHDSREVWITFSGYGTSHVFRSMDAGFTWSDVSGNLPDIPVQSVAVDPDNDGWAYVGTDLGVYMTTDGGATWLNYSQGMPTAMVLDLVINRAERKMRAATFGNGVYEIPLISSPAAVQGGLLARHGSGSLLELAAGGPNPFRASTAIRFRLTAESETRAEVFDAAGRTVRTLAGGRRPSGLNELRWDGRDDHGALVGAGAYFVRLQAGRETVTAKVVRAG